MQFHFNKNAGLEDENPMIGDRIIETQEQIASFNHEVAKIEEKWLGGQLIKVAFYDRDLALMSEVTAPGFAVDDLSYQEQESDPPGQITVAETYIPEGHTLFGAQTSREDQSRSFTSINWIVLAYAGSV